MKRMRHLAKFAECMDVADAADGSIERSPTLEEMSALLRAVAAAARPGARCMKTLAQVVRVLRRCPWVKGELLMELVPGGNEATFVDLYTEHEGVRERLLPAVRLPLPFDDVERALADTAESFAPLELVRRGGKLVFTAWSVAATVKPPRTELVAESTPPEGRRRDRRRT
jgi:hypothetical protein